MHTANYDISFDHGGKIVAIIGNGSSGVQALPAIQPTAKKVIHIVRSPAWILPPFGSRNFNPTGENFLCTSLDGISDLRHRRAEICMEG